MPCLVAIEKDPKCYKEIQENWAEVTKELGHEVLLFKNMAEFNTEFAKPENASKAILLFLISFEEIKGDLASSIEALKAQYKADVLISMFEDPLKPFKKSNTLPVQNIIYKPFDLTILKEHSRFALMSAQKIKTQFVHTTQANTEIESLKKFKVLQISEFGFKISKDYPLEKNKIYKFYHPLFAHKKNQHIWARLINENADHYELFFCQTSSFILSQLRKRVASSAQKVKNPIWRGLSQNNQVALKVALQIADQPTLDSLQDLLSRNFAEVTFHTKIDPKQKIAADIFITDASYDSKGLDSQFEKSPIVFRVYQDPLARHDLEKRFEIEYARIEKPIDRAFLVKAIKLLFPMLEENEEEIQRVTIELNEITALAEVLKVQEFSEAAITFTHDQKYTLGQMLEIALPQEDETTLQEMNAKIHFASDKPNQDKVYEYQFVLFGMKDEYLKNIRLWSLQKHIEKSKNK